MPRKKLPTADVKIDPLPRRLRVFVSEYSRSNNGAEAARFAGYSSPRQMAHELLARPDIQRELKLIASMPAELKERVLTNMSGAMSGSTPVSGRAPDIDMGIWQFERSRVLKQVAVGCFADTRELFGIDGSPTPIHELTPEQASLIEAIEVFERFGGADEGGERKVIGRTFKYKISKRQPWADMLMRHLGEYQKDNKQKGEGQGEGAVNAFAALVAEMRGSTLPIVKTPVLQLVQQAEAG